MKNTPQEACLKAAAKIAAGREQYSCIALATYGGEVAKYEKLFRPKWREISMPPSYVRYGTTGAWGCNWGIEKVGREWHENKKDSQNCRVLALCFMAAMTE